MKNVNFHTCTFADDKLWFITVEGYFMNIDIHSMRASFVYVDQQIKLNTVTDKMLAVGKSIYWIEQGGGRMIEYDICAEKCAVFNLPKVEMVDWECFAAIAVWEKNIYIVPKCVDKLIIFDTETKQIVERESRFGTLLAPIQTKCLFDFSIQDGSDLYLFCSGKNKILKYNLSGDDIETIIYSFEMGKVKSAVKEKNEMYIMTDNCEIFHVDAHFALKEKIQYEEVYEKSYMILLMAGTSFYILPSLEKDIFWGQQMGSSVNKYMDYPDDFRYTDMGWSKYYRFTEGGGYIWLPNRSSNYLARMNQCTGALEWIHVNAPSVEEEYKYCLYSDKKVFHENNSDLKLLLMMSGNDGVKSDSDIGEKIWRQCSGK